MGFRSCVSLKLWYHSIAMVFSDGKEQELHEMFMEAALVLAREAARHGEVPIGAVVVRDNQIIAEGYNLRETNRDPVAHAEVVALRKAAARLGGWRLANCDLYVTIEPCPMCAGALIQARIRRVIYGADDPKAGAAGSVVNLFQPGLFNHDVEVIPGVLNVQCGQVMKEFFARRRK